MKRVFRILGLVGLVILAALIVWRGLAVGLSGIGASPIAVRLWPTSSTAAASFAELMLLARKPQDAEASARSALAGKPQDAEALRVLGLSAEAQGDDALARQAMTMAARLGWRDSATQLWMLRRALAGRDFESAAQHADALLRVGQQPRPIFALLRFVAAQPDGSDPVASRLADRPSWREGFFADAAALQDGQVAGFARLFPALESAGSAPTRYEVAPFVLRLLKSGQLPAARNLLRRYGFADGRSPSGLYDGGFDRFAETMPRISESTAFEWGIVEKVRPLISVDSDAEARGRPTLRLRNGEDYRGTVIRQMLTLGPGRYRLSYRTDKPLASIQTPTARWNVDCWPGARRLNDGQRDLGGPEGDRTITYEFSVPAQGCAAQRLDLRGRMETGASDEVSIRDLRVDSLSSP